MTALSYGFLLALLLLLVEQSEAEGVEAVVVVVVRLPFRNMRVLTGIRCWDCGLRLA
jgi:hypothetical protein